MVVRPSCGEFCRELRIEPVLWLCVIAVFSYNVGVNNIILQKTCFPEGPPGLDAKCTDDRALKTVTTMNTVRNTLRECLPGIVVLFAGSWRDHTGLSRPLIFFGLTGEIINVILNIISSFYWNLSPWVTIGVEDFLSLTGSRCLVSMASMAYVAERTTDENRAIKMGTVMVGVLGGIAIASAAGGYFLTLLDYTWYFTMILIIYLGSFMYAFLRVKDSVRRDLGSKEGPFSSIKKLKVIFEKKPNGSVVWLLVISTCILTTMISSEGNVSYLFLHKVMKFTPDDAGYVGAYKMLLTIITAFTLIPILKRYFHFSDFTIAIASTIPSAIACILMIFAKTKTQVYMFVTLDLMRVILITTLWSLIVECVKKTEVGVYMSFISFGEAIAPIAMNPLYSYVFNKTINTLPGAFHLVSFGIILMSTVLISISSLFYIKQPSISIEEIVKESEVNGNPISDHPLP